MVDITSKLSLNITQDLTETMRQNQSRRVLIHAGCVTCGAHLRRRKISILHEIPMMDIFIADVPIRALPVLASMGYIKHIEDDAPVHICVDIARPTIGADLPPASSLTGKGLTIALVDTGVFPHIDFGYPTRIKYFLDLVNQKTDPYDDNGHGTFCAGCAVGDGAASKGLLAGFAREADLIMIKAIAGTGSGNISDILRAFQWISDHAKAYNIKVVSMSAGIDVSNMNPQKDTLAEAAGVLWDQGITVVAGAGNGGPKEGTIISPGTSPKIITVGAADDRTTPGKITLAPFSSRSKPGGKKPDILSPGVDISSLGTKEGSYIILSGTSMATPIVAGCAAMILQQFPHYTPDDVKKALLDHAVTLGLPENHQGKGIISLNGIF